MSEVSNMAVKPPVRLVSSTPVADLDTGFLFENIVCDLHWTAVNIGTISLLLSARLRTDAAWTLRPWRHILIDDRKIMQLALRYCARIGVSQFIGARLSALYEAFGAAKISIEPLVKSQKGYTSLEMRAIGDAAAKLRRLSLEGAAVIGALKEDVMRRLSAPYASDAQALVKFLTEAARGEIGRINAFGEISLPTLSQRRKTPRIAARRSCRLVLPTVTLPAQLYDVSRGGLGVICQYAFAERQSLTVELDDGRRLAATVVRQNGDRVGLLLAAQLATNDPLLLAPGLIAFRV